MFKLFKCLLVISLLITAISCQGGRAPFTQANSPGSTLLYSGYNDDLQDVIKELDLVTQISRLWVEDQGICCPARSPDRNQVVYFEQKRLEEYSLWVAGANGQEAMQIGGTYSFRAGLMSAEWSFDSQYIAFRASPDRNSAMIYVLDAATGQEITSLGGWDFAWSPTLNQLVVYGGSGLRVVDIPSGQERWVLDVFIPNHNHSLDWTSDGRTIIFPKDVDTLLSSIYAVDVDGSNLRELTHDTQQYVNRAIGNIQVSPDGDHLLFVCNTYRTDEGVSDTAALMILNLTSGEVHQVASGVSGPIVWSPDGMRVVFGSTEDAEGEPIEGWDLFQVSLEDGAITRLTFDNAAPNGLTW